MSKKILAPKMSLGHQRIEMSPDDLRISRHGDEGQGDKLVQRKYASPSRHSPDKMMLGPRIQNHNNLYGYKGIQGIKQMPLQNHQYGS